ncbi:MAG: 5-deoxy-glucuronate isomerase [Chthonomonadales bacterium]
MNQLYFPAQTQSTPVREILSPATAPLQWLRLSTIRLQRQHSTEIVLKGEEGVLDIFSGTCTVEIRSRTGDATYREIGQRANVFAGLPFMVYLPLNATATITADSDTLEIALITAKADVGYEPKLVYPDEAVNKVVGKDNWQRSVVTSIGEDVQAQRLLVGETVNPPGNWSSSPPHKHDCNTPPEAKMEEVYYYKTNPLQGFGMQRMYTAPGYPEPMNECFVVQSGDAVAIPGGYHPVVAAPGYQLFYLWALAGETRSYGAGTDDPEHAWILGMK